MFEANNRQALTQQLRPPAGYRLSHAVGTTFTLDMVSALAVPLSFVAGSGEEFNNPVAVLSAVRKVAGRVDVFCQAGHIKAPKSASDLMSVLEPMVHQVSPRHGLFHPKVWVLEYERDGEFLYRFLSSSRNLTPDTSWDLLVRLDGAPAKSRTGSHPDNPRLARFIRALPGLCTVTYDAGRLAALEGLASRLATVAWELPDDIQQLGFFPLGIGERRIPGSMPAYLSDPGKYPALNGKTGAAAFQGRQKLIISPFLDDTMLNRFNDRYTEDVYLFSRADQLDLLSPATIGNSTFKFQAFNDAGILPGEDQPDVPQDSEFVEEGENAFEDLSGLHAKAYFCDYDHFSHMLLGSANATMAGFTKNVEFLVEMRGRKTVLGVNNILENLKSVPFENYCGTGGSKRSEDDEAGFKLESLLREAAATAYDIDPQPGAASGDGDGNDFTVVISHQWFPPPGVNAHLRLLSLPQPRSAVEPSKGMHEHRFHRIPLADVTPYLVLTLEDPASAISRNTVIQGNLLHDPDGRLDAVIARQLNDPEKLREFLLYFLTPEDAPNSPNGGGSWSFGGGLGGSGTQGLFEALVGAVSGGNAATMFAELRPVIDRLVAAQPDSPDIAVLQQLWTAAVVATEGTTRP